VDQSPIHESKPLWRQIVYWHLGVILMIIFKTGSVWRSTFPPYASVQLLTPHKCTIERILTFMNWGLIHYIALNEHISEELSRMLTTVDVIWYLINVQLRGYYDQLFVFKNSKTHGTIVCSKIIKPHFIGKKGKHSTFDEYVVNFPIPTPIIDYLPP
jgi:hypothetical protein